MNKNMKYIKNTQTIYGDIIPPNDTEIIESIDNINKDDISSIKSNEEKLCIICIQGTFININNNNNNNINNNNNAIEYVKFINTIEYVTKSCDCNFNIHDSCFCDWLKEKLECPICHNSIIIHDKNNKNNNIKLNNEDNEDNEDRNDMYININLNENEELLNRLNQNNDDRRIVSKYLRIIICIVIFTYIMLLIKYYYF
jgi:hypothetical protein